jgi:ribonucleoside-diphosphate reductase alpha chain
MSTREAANTSTSKVHGEGWLKPVVLSPNARVVLEKRYLRRGPQGTPIETVEEMFWRVAKSIAAAEKDWGQEVQPVAVSFYDLLTSLRFFPNSPTFTGAGTPLGQLAACFVLPITDDMGRDPAGIFQTLRDAALIQQTGGGNGFSFSRLRPKGSLVKSSSGRATGPVGFLGVYDEAFGVIAQGGTRRGANMAVLRVDHPDVEDFVNCKTDETAITNFNISVGVLDGFMRAVRDDGEWELVFPDVDSREYHGFSGTIEQAKDKGVPLRVYKRVRARDLFQKIVRQAHHNGEPGVLFLDAANRSNPVPHLYPLEATNPCGEQWLGPYENCCLGSINLAQHLAPEHRVDWDKLRESIALSTRFLDDVVSANAYVPAVPQLKQAADQARRIGLGIMGLADLMYHVGIRYGSEEGQEFASQVVEFVRYHTLATSIDLARSRGAFPAIEGSIYGEGNFTWTAPRPIQPHIHDWARPALDWATLEKDMRRHGVRNAAQCTIAPTGTIATVAGCEGYGCEPVFALAYVRHVNDNGRDLQLPYVSPLFEKALDEAALDPAVRAAVVEQVVATGTCQDVEELPEGIRRVFVVSQDISAEEHVRMQAAMQAFVDNSLSKTINFPPTATEEDVAKAYLLAWELGCKGITVYVTGSREKVVLETVETAKAKGKEVTIAVAPQPEPAVAPEKPVPLWRESKRPRPTRLEGCTYQVNTPLGKAFITVNQNGGGQPFEAFVNTSKAGSETAAVSEALGRLISYVLRVDSPILPRDRLAEVVRQLAGIGGGRPFGFGPNRVLSLPDGVARALAEYLGQTPQPLPVPDPIAFQIPVQQMHLQIGDLCPQCGEAAVVNEEGCRKCYACGHSEC